MIHFTCPAFVFFVFFLVEFRISLHVVAYSMFLFPFLTLVSFPFLLECIPVHHLLLYLVNFCRVHTFRQDKLLFIIQHTLCFQTVYILGRIYTNCPSIFISISLQRGGGIRYVASSLLQTVLKVSPIIHNRSGPNIL